MRVPGGEIARWVAELLSRSVPTLEKCLSDGDFVASAQDFDRFLISGPAKSAQEVAQLREALRNFLRTWLQAMIGLACRASDR
jgi:hypothetical protein